jgi:hypothetical protein
MLRFTIITKYCLAEWEGDTRILIQHSKYTCRVSNPVPLQNTSCGWIPRSTRMVSLNRQYRSVVEPTHSSIRRVPLDFFQGVKTAGTFFCLERVTLNLQCYTRPNGSVYVRTGAIFRRICKIAKSDNELRHVRLYVCPSACNNSGSHWTDVREV